jgi:hypothetical protein
MVPMIYKRKLYPDIVKQCILFTITPVDYGPNCIPDPILPDTWETLLAKRKFNEIQKPQRLTLQQHLYPNNGLKNCLSVV